MKADDPAASLASLLREHHQQGQPIDALQTLDAHPDWWTSKSVVLDLAYEEFCQRREAGEHVDPDQFCTRFPVYQSSLRRTLEVHQLIDENPAALSRLEAMRWPEPGEEFLGFRLERELGRGAFARVFQATEVAVGSRAVAVKISAQGAAEADTLGKLDHPHIVPILYVQKDQATGLSVVCMPYLGSATLCDVLDSVLARGNIPTDADIFLDAVHDDGGAPTNKPKPFFAGGYVDGVLRIALGIVEAMAYMHGRNICHFDLKPPNVLLTPDGRPMLLDFNLAVDAQKDQQQIGGTLPYMSPEQLVATGLDRRADPTAIGPPSDVFSLGVLLYELLTGKHPFGPIPLASQELRKMLLERQQAPVAPICRQNRWVDRSVVRMIESCLAHDPHQRPRADELVRFFGRSLSPWGRWRRWLTRHRWSALAGTICFSVALAGIVALVMSRGTASERAYARGQQEYDQGHWVDAVQLFERALAADQHFTPAIVGRAYAHQKLQQYDLALFDYGKLDPAQCEGKVLACMGYCAAHRRSYAEAVLYHETAVAKGYETAVVYNNLGWCQLRQSQLTRAENSLNRAVQLNDRLQAAYHNLARVERQLMTQAPGYVPVKGIENARTAMELGPITTDLAFDAAYLCTFAAKSNREWVGPALDYLALAIRLGLDPKQVSNDVMFKTLAAEPAFATVLKTAPQQPRHDSKPLLDPLDD